MIEHVADGDVGEHLARAACLGRDDVVATAAHGKAQRVVALLEPRHASSPDSIHPRRPRCRRHAEVGGNIATMAIVRFGPVGVAATSHRAFAATPPSSEALPAPVHPGFVANYRSKPAHPHEVAG